MTIAGRADAIQAARAYFPQFQECLNELEKKAGEREIKAIVCVRGGEIYGSDGQFWLEATLEDGGKVGAILG